MSEYSELSSKQKLLKKILLNRTKKDEDLSSVSSHQKNLTLLTPIQKWVQGLKLAHPLFFNMGFTFQLNENIDISRLQDSFYTICQRHECLRTELMPNYEGISQNIFPFEKEKFKILEMDIRDKTFDQDFLDNQLFQWQLNSEKHVEGHIRAMIVRFSDRIILNVCCHHWMVDAVSWGIIFKEWDALYHNAEAKLSPIHDTIFDWCNQINKIKSEELDTSYWKQHDSSTKHSTACTVNQRETRSTIIWKNSALMESTSSRLDLLILAGFSEFLMHVQNLSELNITVEHHGRFNSDKNMLAWSTIGWFTTFFPITIYPKNDFRQYFEAIFETFEKLKGKESNYMLSYHSNHYDDFKLPKIAYNYVSMHTNQYPSNFIFADMVPIKTLVHPENEIPFTLEFTVIEKKEYLECIFQWDPNSISTKSIENCIEQLCNKFNLKDQHAESST